MNGVNYAVIENKMGDFVEPTAIAVQTAMDGVDIHNLSSLAIPLLDIALEDLYPIASYTYILVYGIWHNNCQSVKSFVRYINISLTGEHQRQECTDAGMVPLSANMVNVVRESILKTITCEGRNVWALIEHEFEAENQEENKWRLPVAIGMSVLFVAPCILLAYIIKEKIKVRRLLDSNEWAIDINEITFQIEDKNNQSIRSRLSEISSYKSFTHISEIPNGQQLMERILHWPGKWKTHQIGIRLLYMSELQNPTLQMKRTILWMRDSMIHANVVRFFGLTEVDSDRYIIGDYCAKGPLHLILQDVKYNLTKDFKFSVAYNVASGIQFLHSENIVHGNLRSSNCLIDSHWTVKICDWECFKLSQAAKFAQHPGLLIEKNMNDMGIQTRMFLAFWVAPEVLRKKYDSLPTHAGDVFSFSIILQEIFTREDPYSEHADIVLPSEIINGILNNSLRPQPTADIPTQIRQIMEIAWTDTPSLRPTIGEVVKLLHQANPRRRSVLDSMVEAMEEYTCHLETVIEEQTMEMEIVRCNNNELLSSLLPAQLSSNIIEGLQQENGYNSMGIIFLETENIGSLLDSFKPSESIHIMDEIYTRVGFVCKQYGVHQISMPNCAFIFLIGFEAEADERSSYLHENICELCLDLMSCSHEKNTFGSNGFVAKFRISADFGRLVAGVSSTVIPNLLVFGKVFKLITSRMKYCSGNKIIISGDLKSQLEENGGHFITTELENVRIQNS